MSLDLRRTTWRDFRRSLIGRSILWLLAEAHGGAMFTAMTFNDRRLQVLFRIVLCVGRAATVTTPELDGPSGETAVNRFCKNH